MKVIVNSNERYPEWILDPDPDNPYAWSIPDELYARHIKALAEFDAVQKLIEEWQETLPRFSSPSPHGCGSCG